MPEFLLLLAFQRITQCRGKRRYPGGASPDAERGKQLDAWPQALGQLHPPPGCMQLHSGGGPGESRSAERGPGRISGFPSSGMKPQRPEPRRPPHPPHCTPLHPARSPRFSTPGLAACRSIPVFCPKGSIKETSPRGFSSPASPRCLAPFFLAPYLLVPQAEQDASSPGVAVTRPDPSIAAKDCACAVAARWREIGKGRGPAGGQRWTVTSLEGGA